MLTAADAFYLHGSTHCVEGTATPRIEDLDIIDEIIKGMLVEQSTEPRPQLEAVDPWSDTWPSPALATVDPWLATRPSPTLEAEDPWPRPRPPPVLETADPWLKAPLPPPEPQLSPPYRPPVEIIEQPVRRVRYRYGSELQHRNRGSIRGLHSTLANETYPTIRINHNNSLHTVVVVSCVTRNEPHRVHPHSLFGPDTRDGVLVGRPAANNEFEIIRIGIHRATNCQVDQELRRRAQMRVTDLNTYNTELQIDPYGQGFEHAATIGRRDLLELRLAFQVFVNNRQEIWEALPPVVTEPIFHENAATDSLEIRWVSNSSGTFAGDETVALMLYERVHRNVIEVVFYESDAANAHLWERVAAIMRIDHCTIVFKTPPCGRASDTRVDAFLALRRSVRGVYQYGDPQPFQYIPVHHGPALRAENQMLWEPRNRLRVQPSVTFTKLSNLKDESALSGEDETDLSDLVDSDDSGEDHSDHSSESTDEDESDDSEDHSDHSSESSDEYESDDSESLHKPLQQLFIHSKDT